MKTKAILLLTLTVLLIQAGYGQEGESTDQIPRGYQIGPGDVITVKVLGEPDFTVESATIDEDGKFQFYNQSLMAKCRTETELRDEVAKLLLKYLKSPQVSVYVKERKSRPPVTVYGEVRQPQQVILTRKATLRELIAFSGGATKDASGIIQVTRTQPLMCSETSDKEWKAASDSGLGFPSYLYSSGSLKSVNPEIYPGDIIDVIKAAPIYVVGEVIKPGEFAMPEGGLPLMQAIAMAGGQTREAKKKEIKVFRRKQGTTQPEVIVVNYEAIKKGEQKDLMLEPFDIVEVGKAKKSFGDILLEVAGGAGSRLSGLPIRPF
jgi:polysaccharide export outer membrane protein